MRSSEHRHRYEVTKVKVRDARKTLKGISDVTEPGEDQ